MSGISKVASNPYLATGVSFLGVGGRYYLNRQAAAREADILQKQAQQQARNARLNAQLTTLASVVQMNQDFDTLQDALAKHRAGTSVTGGGGLHSGSAMGVQDDAMREAAEAMGDTAFDAAIKAGQLESQAVQSLIAGNQKAREAKRRPFYQLVSDLSQLASERAKSGPSIRPGAKPPVINRNTPLGWQPTSQFLGVPLLPGQGQGGWKLGRYSGPVRHTQRSRSLLMR